MFKNHDWIITSLTAVLITIGSVSIYSVTYLNDPTLIYKQLYIVFISFIIYFGIYFANYSWLKEPKILFVVFLVTIALLVFVRFFSQETAGTNRWITLGPLNLQPAEFAKILVIILTAHILGSKSQQEKKEIINSMKSHSLNTNQQTYYLNKEYLHKFLKISVVILPILILILIQPAFGNMIITLSIFLFLSILYYPKPRVMISFAIGLILSALVTYFTLFEKIYLAIILLPIVMYFLIKFSKVSSSSIIIICLVGILIIPILNFGWNNVLKDYQKKRVETFINPQSDPLGSGWQVKQSIVAIGSGRMLGRGFMQGTQASLGILPYAHTDFIFASFAEQFGFLGSFTLLLLLLGLPIRLFMLNTQIKSEYDQIILTGIGLLLLIHITINVGMNLGKLPVTGIPLPLISYGGSSLLSIMVGLGLIQNILKYNKEINNFEKISPRSGFIKST